MKILLIANYQPDRQESMQRVAQLLESELNALGHTVRVIRPEPWVGRLKPGATGIGKWLGYVDKFGLFPPILRRAIVWADVVHICDHSNAFYTRYLQQVPHVVTCNDLLAIRSAKGEIPQNPTRWSGKQLQNLILAGLNQAQRVICISQKTREDLLRLSQLSPEAVSCVYLGLNYPYAPLEKTIAQTHLAALNLPLNVPFLLHVGGNHWYKNREGVVKIFQQLRSQLQTPDLYLVLAGAPIPPEIQDWIATYDRNHPQTPSLGSRVLAASNVSNEDLRALYSLATALLFPSWQEGYGWPILEAHACGCPVFTTDRPPMTEVGGTAAFYLDPEDVVRSATTIAQALPNLPQTIAANLLNADRFKNSTMIAGYLREYKQAIQEKTS